MNEHQQALAAQRYLDRKRSAREGIEERRAAQHTQRRERDLGRMTYATYLKTYHWQSLRAEKLRAAGWKCERCGSGRGPLNVHHLTYDRRGDEDLADLAVLCEPCHLSTPHPHRMA